MPRGASSTAFALVRPIRPCFDTVYEIWRPLLGAVRPLERGDVDDLAASLRGHLRGSMLGAEERPGQVDCDAPVKVGSLECQNRLASCRAGIVDANVDPAEALARAGARRPSRGS